MKAVYEPSYLINIALYLNNEERTEHTIYFPEWVKWIAVDADGQIYGYEIEPERKITQWTNICPSKFEYIANLELPAENWGSLKFELDGKRIIRMEVKS